MSVPAKTLGTGIVGWSAASGSIGASVVVGAGFFLPRASVGPVNMKNASARKAPETSSESRKKIPKFANDANKKV
jgi:hypothetical protein